MDPGEREREKKSRRVSKQARELSTRPASRHLYHFYIHIYIYVQEFTLHLRGRISSSLWPSIWPAVYAQHRVLLLHSVERVELHDLGRAHLAESGAGIGGVGGAVALEDLKKYRVDAQVATLRSMPACSSRSALWTSSFPSPRRRPGRAAIPGSGPGTRRRASRCNRCHFPRPGQSTTRRTTSQESRCCRPP